eukprot:3891846-Alexandrium_andersonii.AAC.1
MCLELVQRLVGTHIAAEIHWVLWLRLKSRQTPKLMSVEVKAQPRVGSMFRLRKFGLLGVEVEDEVEVGVDIGGR